MDSNGTTSPTTTTLPTDATTEKKKKKKNGGTTTTTTTKQRTSPAASTGAFDYSTFYEFLKKENSKLKIFGKLPFEIIVCIVRYLTLDEMEKNCCLICKHWYSALDEDQNNFLWKLLSGSNDTLKQMSSESIRMIKQVLKKEKSNWRRFLWVWNDLLQASRWCRDPSELASTNSGNPLTLVSNAKEHRTVTHIGEFNTNASVRLSQGFSASYPTGYVEFKVITKGERWNIGIGLAEENFITQGIKRFVGCHPQSWSYSSDGRIRYQGHSDITASIHPTCFEEFGTEDRIGMFVDLNANSVTFFKNGQSIHTLTNVRQRASAAVTSAAASLNNNGGGGGEVTPPLPAAVTSFADFLDNTLYPTITMHSSGDAVAVSYQQILMSRWKMLELFFRAESSYQQKRMQRQLKSKLLRLKHYKDKMTSTSSSSSASVSSKKEKQNSSKI